MIRKFRKSSTGRSLSVHVDNVMRGVWNVSTLSYPADGGDDVRDGPWDDSFNTKREAVAFAKEMAKADVADGSFADATILVDGTEVASYRPRRAR